MSLQMWEESMTQEGHDVPTPERESFQNLPLPSSVEDITIVPNAPPKR